MPQCALRVAFAPVDRWREVIGCLEDVSTTVRYREEVVDDLDRFPRQHLDHRLAVTWLHAHIHTYMYTILALTTKRYKLYLV